MEEYPCAVSQTASLVRCSSYMARSDISSAVASSSPLLVPKSRSLASSRSLSFRSAIVLDSSRARTLSYE